MLWLALHLPDLPLLVHTRGAPEAGPLAVTSGHPRPRIVAANPPASALGIAPGDTVANALAVAPGLLLRPREPALEAATLEELACWSERYTPRISLDPPAGLLLEVSASLRLFGGLQALASELMHDLGTLGLRAGLAAAPTPLAARWLASTQPGRLLSAQDDWQATLAPLPLVTLSASGLAPDTLALLHAIGACTLGQARRLPRAALMARKAGALLDLLARAYGETPDLRTEHSPPARYQARMLLPVAATTLDPLLFAARRLFAGLAGWLGARQAAIDHCRLQLEHESGPDSVLELLSSSPTRDPARLNLLARERLNAHRLRAPVTGLKLESGLPQPLAPRSDDLFGDPDSARENAGLLLDRLRARLGADAVCALRPLADHRPERAWTHAPPGQPCKPAALPAGARPLWLLTTPRALGRQPRLQLLSGPERIESGWWDNAEVRRDYWVAQDEGAALCWVFQALDPPAEWYLHGYFG